VLNCRDKNWDFLLGGTKTLTKSYIYIYIVYFFQFFESFSSNTVQYCNYIVLQMPVIGNQRHNYLFIFINSYYSLPQRKFLKYYFTLLKIIFLRTQKQREYAVFSRICLCFFFLFSFFFLFIIIIIIIKTYFP
jgi:hypothetical protein